MKKKAGVDKKDIKLSKDYDKLHKKLSKIKPSFDKSIKKVASKNHSTVFIPPLKLKERAMQKAKTKYEGDMTKVTDLLRASIVSRIYSRVDEIVNDIERNFEVIRIKDRFKSPKYDNYRDILINVKFKNTIAEIQIHVNKLLDTKEYLNHLFYRINQIIQAQKKTDKRDFFSWEEHIMEDIIKIEKYSNQQAWYRQLAYEKGQDLKKMIYFITHNLGKFEEAKSIIPSIKLMKIDLPEIQSNNHKKIVKEKVMSALEHMDAKIVVEDFALFCDGLKGLPGPLHRFYLEKMSVRDLAKIVMLTGNTKATAVSYICFAETPSKLHFFKGETRGKIVLPRGKNGFDWDPIFQPEGHDKTYAEMSLEEKNSISMRKIAFDKLLKFLHKKYDIAL
jgi:inosine triphosphate pyrophosphatase